jgi:uncharacterized tellurite resistance protein B-like protein
MLDRFLAFLKNLPDPQKPASADDPRVAAAALLYHLMDADGVRDADEAEQLPAMLAESFGIAGAELEAVMAAGEKADGEAVDLYAFTSVLNRHLAHEAKRSLILSMWELVYADGELHELEDNVVWRVAELLHVERDERVAMRLRAREAAGIVAS